MNKLNYRAFKTISALNLKSSLLYLVDSTILLLLIFYINNFFDNFQNFENLFAFLRDYFFSRVK